MTALVPSGRVNVQDNSVHVQVQVNVNVNDSVSDSRQVIQGRASAVMKDSRLVDRVSTNRTKCSERLSSSSMTA